MLEADLGRRRITWFRLVRPLVLAAGVIAFYIEGVVTRGDGLTFELALAGLGVFLGLTAGASFVVYRDVRGRAMSSAGLAYAALWVVVISARLGFTYSTMHVQSVQHWLGAHRISPEALTDALIFMAAGMLLARTATLLYRARSSAAGAPTAESTVSRTAELIATGAANPQ